MRYNLLRNYSLASAVAVIAVTVILAVFFNRYATDGLVTSVEHQNVILASLLGNDLSARIPSHFKTDIHDTEDLATAHHIQHVKKIDAILKNLLKSLPVLKIKAYLNDLTIYSSDHSQIGEIKSSPGFRKTHIQGIPASKLSFRGEFNTFEGVISNRNVVETYVPVSWLKTMTGEPARLIIEIYTDVTPLVAEIEQSTVNLVLGLIFLFAAFYGVLVLIVRRADGIIGQQYANLNRQITERDKAETLVRESEERLRGAIESLREGFILFDADDRIMMVNDVYRRINSRADEFLEKNMRFEDLLRANVEKGQLPQAIGREEAFVRERLKQHRNPQDSILRQTDDGSWYIIKETRTPEGGTAVTFTDITERKRAEERLIDAMESVNEGVILYDADDRIVYCNSSLRESFNGASDLLVQGTRFEDLHRAIAERGLIKGAKDDVEKYVRTRLDQHRDPKGPIEREMADGRWLQISEYKTSDGGTFILGLDITERKHDEEIIIRSENRLRGAIDSLREGFVLFDADDRIVMFNSVYRRINPKADKFLVKRMRFEDLLRANVESGQIVDAIGREKAFIRERLEQHRNPQGPILRQTDDGSWYIIKETHTPEGGTAVTFTDITERKQVEEALENSEVRLRRSVLDAPIPVIMHAEDGEVLMISNKWTELSGYSISDIPTIQDWTEKAYGADKELMKRQRGVINDLYDLKEPGEHDAHITTASGEKRMWQVRNAPLGRLPDGRRFVISMAVDVTERLEAEEALRKSEMLFRAVVDHSPAKIHIKDTDGRYMLINKEAEKLFGVTHEEGLGKTSYDLFPKEMAEAFMEHDREVLVSGEATEEEAFTLDDGVHTYLTVKFPIYDLDGVSAVGAIGTDITELKQSEEALRRSEERLRGAIESLQEGFVLFDADDRLVMMNDVYRRMDPVAEGFLELGMSFEDSIRAYVEHGLIVEALGREEAFIRERMEKHRNPKGTIIRQFTNGAWYIIEETRTPDGGSAMTFTDITGLKHFESALTETQQRFKDMAESSSDWFWEMGPDLRFTYFSDRYQEITHFDPKDRLGTQRMDFVPESELRANAEKWAAHLADLEARRPFRDFEYASTATSEGTRHIRVSGKPVFDADGNFLGYRGTGSDISEYKWAEQALKDREEHFRAVTETAPNAIINIDQGGKVIMWNKAAEKIFGYGEAEIVGKSVTKIVPKRFHKRHKNGLRRVIETGRSDLTGKTTELMGLRKDGTEFPVELSLSMWEMEGKKEKNFVGILRDITESKKAEEALHKLSQAVEQSPAAVIITDTDGTIEYVNPTFTTITGYSSEEAIGLNPRILKSGETPDAVYERLWADIKSGKEWRGTLRNKRKDGTMYLAGVSIAPITAPDGTVTHFVWAEQDITERVETERRLKQTEKMESIGGLAGGIAHDFNNMLLPILSLTDMTRKSLPEDSRDRLRLDKVIEAATRAKDLVARILAFSRQEDAKRENIDIHAAVHETMDLLRSTLLTTIKIKQRLKRDTGTVFADHAQIASVLLNLASNAADAMEGKTGEIAVSLAPVKVGKKKATSIPGLHEGKYAKLAVKDNGHGMDEKTLARVMDPFFTTKAVGEGTGLGLSMIHGIVSKHGGAVHIITAPGKGTTVEVYLPLVDGEADHESRDGDDVSGDVRTSAGRSHQPEAAMEKQARKH